MLLSDLQNKKVAVWGFGAEGKAAFNFLQSYGVSADIITDNNEDSLTDYDIVIKSPGISLYKDICILLKQQNTVLTSGTNLFLDYVKALPTKPVLIAVTGTKGKSTTTALLAHILNSLGKKALTGANFGTPLLDLIPTVRQGKVDYIVAEISSYQAADLHTGFDIALLNNFYPEHINWHLTHENYYRDKLNLIYKSDIKILNKANAETIELLKGKNLNAIYFNDTKGFYVKEQKVFYRNKYLLGLYDTSLQGEHNLSNIAAVLTIINHLGFDTDNDTVKQALQSFKPLPHRLEKVTEKEGLTFIDDSISTTPETAIAALEVFKDKPITLLAGGFEREQDYTRLITEICKNNVTLVALPTTGKRLFDAVSAAKGKAYMAKDMADAVAFAKDVSEKGSIILLSPAAPSYDFYKNFQERGNLFKSFI